VTTEVPAPLRLFIAVLAPPAVQATATTAQGRLRAQALPVRWVDPVGIHVTLQFLGTTEPEHLPSLSSALAGVAAGARPMTLRTAGLGVFPTLARARVVWLGLAGEVERLAVLQAAVLAATGPLGFVAEARPFTPHVTLGRVRDTATPAERAAVGQAVAATPAPPLAAWPVDDLALMASTLGPRGATYRAVGRWRLGSGAAVATG
jgi:RNA 2',3'-cyclic 3'-phosphodiesterase